MKLETYLDAMEYALEMVDWIQPGDMKWERRYHACRARILRVDAEIAKLQDKLAWCERELDLEKRINLEESNDD